MSNEYDNSETGPVRIVEDADTGDRFLIYQTERGVKVELRYEGERLWMTQAQMADLFGRDVSVISRHIANSVEEGEIRDTPDLHFVQIRGPRDRTVTAYSLDVIMSVGYRVSSAQGALFRRWATGVLVRFATKGFVVDVERLKAPGQHDRVAELREIIRDIRSAEANLYAELRGICAMCQDYDGSSEVAHTFYRHTQAKLFYAVTNLTPAQVLISRADSNEPNMGLQTWSKDHPIQADAKVAKNYLRPLEMEELNRLTSILLDIFEDQLKVGRLVTMVQAEQLLDQQLRSLNRLVLNHGGPVTHDRAESRAKAEYKRFDAARKKLRKAETDRELAELRALDKSLPKSKKAKGV